jgi:hypothetical protein
VNIEHSSRKFKPMRMRPILHRTLTVVHLLKIFPAFYKPACSLLCSQQRTMATASHPVAKTHFNIVLTAMLTSTK